jgi:hypothetical protein
MEEQMVQRGLECNPPIKFSYGGVVSQTTGALLHPSLPAYFHGDLCGWTDGLYIPPSPRADSHRLIEKARELKGEEGQLRLVERYVLQTYLELLPVCTSTHLLALLNRNTNRRLQAVQELL